MSDDWQPNDLALCVMTRDFISHGVICAGGHKLRKGAIYTVASIASHSNLGTPGPVLHMTDGSTGGARRFRKIAPHKPDAEDLRTIALLNGERVS